MVNIYTPTAQDGLSSAEIVLYDQLMDYRAQLGLPAIPLSKALTTTAARHVVDIADNLGTAVSDQLPGENRAHSWSDAAYNAKDPNTYGAIWNAPARLGTGYAGYGFEILATGTGSVVRSTPEQTASVLLTAWKMSSGHNAVMTNQGDWKSYSWNAVGVAVYKNSAAIWFGREADPTGGPAIDGFDPLRYLAGNADLAQAFGTDTAAAQSHYIQFGAREGRSTTAFNPHQYLAGYGDLMAAFGSDAQAAENHYIQSGLREGRSATAFDADAYLASNPDLLAAFGSDRDAASRHYIDSGRMEQRRLDGFDAAAYERANPDIAAAFGADLTAATRHYVEYGYHEHRRTAIPPSAAQGAPLAGSEVDSLQFSAPVEEGSLILGRLAEAPADLTWAAGVPAVPLAAPLPGIGMVPFHGSDAQSLMLAFAVPV
ncbi:CAP domain-containing protein [Azospirillum lipoferum]|uniref:SCP domain-containing protein n=1 Tax=Azospirillum lipoferum (strain 4B) TaxID=862719 RepID=G7ZA21_AZOL4|nr:CAP domain-containing protein [Azospirillum lipoferum]CBS88444.1 protein of unknown function [Azospirillum lipoferum 4B]